MKETFYKAMGKRIAAIRRERGWSQEGLAAETEVTASYIARIEIGIRRPTLDVLGQIADALEVPIWRLLTENRMTTEERSWKRNARELSELVDDMPAKDVKLLTQLARRIHAASL